MCGCVGLGYECDALLLLSHWLGLEIVLLSHWLGLEILLLSHWLGLEILLLSHWLGLEIYGPIVEAALEGARRENVRNVHFVQCNAQSSLESLFKYDPDNVLGPILLVCVQFPGTVGHICASYTHAQRRTFDM